MTQASDFMPEWNAPDRIKMLLSEAYALCSATAILNHRSVGRGIVFLGYDMAADRIVSFYIPRKHFYSPDIKEMFSDPAWESIRTLTKTYDMRSEFCVVIPDPIADVFHTIRLPYTAITPTMSNKELQAVIDAHPKQETGSKGTFSTN
jgi:hypothetical protein